MNVSDLYLYVGLAGGWLVGRRWPARGPWVGRASLVAVIVLVALLGASFRDLATATLTEVLPSAILFTGAIVGATAAFYLVLRRAVQGPPAPPASAEGGTSERVPTSALLVVSLFAGYGLGRAVALPTGVLLPVALTVLLALVGYGINLDLSSARRAWVPIASAALGAVVAAAAASLVLRAEGTAAFATALGFGWYSLTGPLVAARLGAAVGLFAFLVNFLREGLTMVLAPYLGPRWRGEGLTALGGATSMDTTLYFVVRYGDPRSGALAVASGLTLTIAASLLVPLILAL